METCAPSGSEVLSHNILKHTNLNDWRRVLFSLFSPLFSWCGRLVIVSVGLRSLLAPRVCPRVRSREFRVLFGKTSDAVLKFPGTKIAGFAVATDSRLCKRSAVTRSVGASQKERRYRRRDSRGDSNVTADSGHQCPCPPLGLPVPRLRIGMPEPD